MIIDSHIHLQAEQYSGQVDELIQEAMTEGVKGFIAIGAGCPPERAATEAVKLAQQYKNIYATVGIHPLDVDDLQDLSETRGLLTHPKVVAVGETGLDFYYRDDNKKLQEKIFRQQIELAHEFQKPLVIHSRNAAEDCLRILKEMEAEKVTGVFHCFPENSEFAEKLQAINFMVSFPGVLTFKNAKSVREAAEKIPLEQIMLETDGPYLSPEPYRGKLCRPAYITETAKLLAEIKGLSTPDCNQIIFENTIRFYNLDPQNFD